jgi:HAD superfamily phosphatase (TIGR01668 family)
VSFWNLLTPTWVVEAVKDVDPKARKARGIDAIITDLDNTLVPWRRYEIAPGVIEWLAKLELEGIKICIASNTLHMRRLKQLAEVMGIPFVDRVRKPGVGGFVRSMAAMGSDINSTAVFGDQIFTDVLAGNRLGLKTILLRPPLSKEEFVSTQLVRYIENVIIAELKRLNRWPAVRRIEEVLESIPDPATPAGRRFALSVVAIPALLIAAVGAIAFAIFRRKK